MEWAPAASALVVNVAWSEPSRGFVPRLLVPSLKVTVPVGVPEPALTVAVKVTGRPETDGFWEEARVVVVAAGLRVTLLLVPVARTEAASVAVMVCVPTVLKTKFESEPAPATSVRFA